MPEYGVNGTTLNLEHLVLKANNAAAWAEDYVLLAGELGIELDTKKYKLGDGTTTWGNLGYYSNPVTDDLVSGLATRVNTAEGTLSSHESRLEALDGTNGEIAGLKAKDSAQDDRLTALESITTVSANPFRA